MDSDSEDIPKVYRVRPRFKVETSFTVDELTEKINRALSKENSPCKGKVKYGYGTLSLPIHEQHYWSPQLSVTLEEDEKATIIRGLYGPRPAVWTMFVFFYALLGFAICIISIVGLSNVSMDKSGTILWLVPVLIILFLSLYLVSYSGQKLGHKQIEILYAFVEDSIGIKI